MSGCGEVYDAADAGFLSTDVESVHSIATEICSAASNYVFSNVADSSLRALEVRSGSGMVLVRRDSVDDRC